MQTNRLEPGATPEEDSPGLLSPQGIRWLLGAGSAITLVSVFRLVQIHWTSLGAVGQYLTLTLATLGVFAAGDVLRHRLRLRHAGGALLAVFTLLVPLVSWGGAVLGVARTPFGFAAATGGAVALAAAILHVLRRTLRYEGRGYAGALGVLLLAPPLLPVLAGSGQGGGLDRLYVLASLVLGVPLLLGARHVNRALFHRDRRDGIDRPLDLLPFTILGVLYAVSLGSLDPTSRLVALPFAIIGATFVATGEEYLRAVRATCTLAHTADASEDTSGTPWPLRSRALLAIGMALVVASVPLAFLAPDLRVAALTSAIAALVFVGFGLRNRSSLSFAMGLLPSLLAYELFPALLGVWAHRLSSAFTHALSLAPASPSVPSFGDVPYVLALVLGTAWLRTRTYPDAMVRCAGTLAAVLTFALPAATLGDPYGAALFAPVAILVAVLALAGTRKIASIWAGHGVLGLATLALARQALGTQDLLAPGPVRLLGLVTVLAALATSFVENGLARVVLAGEPSSLLRLRRSLAIPPVLLGLLPLVVGLQSFATGVDHAGTSIVLGALAIAVGGVRLRDSLLPALAVPFLSLGVHAQALEWSLGPDLVRGFFVSPGGLFHGTIPCPLTLVTIAVAGLVGSRALERFALASRRLDPLVTAARTGLVLHAVLALQWAALGFVSAGVPDALLSLGVLATGFVLAERSRSTLDRAEMALATALVVTWPAFELGSIHLVRSWTAGLAVSGAILATVVALVTRRLAASAGPRSRATATPPGGSSTPSPGAEPVVSARLALLDVRSAWMVLAGLTLVALSGALPFALSLVLLAVLASPEPDPAASPARRLRTVLAGLPVPLLHLAVLLGSAGASSGHLVADLGTGTAVLLPLLAGAALGWSLLVSVWRQAHDEPRAFAEGVILAEILGALTLTAPLLTRLPLADALGLVSAPDLTFGAAANAALLGVALSWAALHARRGLANASWQAGIHVQLWMALALVHGVLADYIRLGSGRAAWVLLAAAVVEHASSELVLRLRGAGAAPFAAPFRRGSVLLVLVSAGIALVRTLDAAPVSSAHGWPLILPAYLASVFLLVTRRTGARPARAIAASSVIGVAVGATVVAFRGIGPEAGFLAPGLTLLVLAQALRRELGRVWQSRLVAAGATFLYATPVVGLGRDLAWGSMVALAGLAVVFGALSFRLRSHALLVVSSGALAIDLLSVIVRLHREAPGLLWVAGALFGLATIAFAALLEHRREGLLQQVRIFGQSFRAWEQAEEKGVTS